MDGSEDLKVAIYRCSDVTCVNMRVARDGVAGTGGEGKGEGEFGR